jgi:transposase
MKTTQETLRIKDNIKEAILYTAFELSLKKWKLAFSNGEKMRTVSIDARNLAQLHEEIDKAKQRFALGDDIGMMSCYEAGRDGFWLHRYLLSCGIDNVVVDSASIEVNRRKRRAKTDRIDVRKLMHMLLRYHGGEQLVWSVVNVPSEAAEDGRQLHRELESLKKERTMHRNRLKSLLIQQGIVVSNPSSRKFLIELEKLRSWDGKELPADLKSRIIREHARLRMVEEQIYALGKQREKRVAAADSDAMKQIEQLMTLVGIGMNSSWKFVMEFFAWRNFKNGKQIGALSGLTPTPYDSGGSLREQGISKAGNARVRTLAVEMAWVWLRFQPQSKLSQWYLKRFAEGGKRMRRIGIVAMARRLLIDLWRYRNMGWFRKGHAWLTLLNNCITDCNE